MSITQYIKKAFPTNKFARSVSVLAGGTVIGQIIVVAASPVLTRLYTPEHFGLFAVFSALINITGVVGTLRYQLAIPLPPDDKVASSALFLSIIILLVVSSSTGVLALAFAPTLSELLNTPQLADYVLLIPVGVLLIGLYDSMRHWSIRRSHFKSIAQSKLLQPLSMTLVQIGCSFLGPVALLLGRLIGQFSGVINLLFSSFRVSPPPREGMIPARLTSTARRYRAFPIYASWTALLNKAGNELPPLVFAAVFSSSAAGIFMLAQRVLKAPAGLISNSVSDVFFSRAPEDFRRNNLHTTVLKVHSALSRLAMPPLFILMLSGPDIFTIIFGQNWTEAGHIARWLAPWIYAVFVISPMRLFTILEKQKQGLVFQYILFSVQLAGIFVGSHYNSMILSVGLMSIGSAACWHGALLWFTHQLEIQWHIVFQELSKTFGYSLIISIPLGTGYLLNANAWLLALLFGLSVSSIIVFYFFILRHSKTGRIPTPNH